MDWQKETSHVTNGTIILHLFNISHFSSLCCAKNFSLISCSQTMAKRMKEQKEGDNRIVAKSRPTAEPGHFLSLQVLHLSNSPIAIEKPGDTQSTLSNRLVKYRETWRKRSQPRRSVESTRDGKKMHPLDVSTRRTCREEEDQEHLNCPEDSASTGKPVAPGYPGNPGNSGNSEPKAMTKIWPHQSPYFNKSCADHLENVFSIVRQRFTVSARRMKWRNLDVNTAVWGMFMSVTIQGAVHLGKDYTEFFLRYSKNQRKKSLRHPFQVIEKLNTDQTGITDHDWLAAICAERDDSGNWQSCSICNCQNLRLCRLSAMSGRH